MFVSLCLQPQIRGRPRSAREPSGDILSPRSMSKHIILGDNMHKGNIEAAARLQDAGCHADPVTVVR